MHTEGDRVQLVVVRPGHQQRVYYRFVQQNYRNIFGNHPCHPGVERYSLGDVGVFSRLLEQAVELFVFVAEVVCVPFDIRGVEVLEEIFGVGVVGTVLVGRSVRSLRKNTAIGLPGFTEIR